MPFPSTLYYANEAGDGAIFFREQADFVQRASKQRTLFGLCKLFSVRQN